MEASRVFIYTWINETEGVDNRVLLNLKQEGNSDICHIWMELENMKWNRPVTEDLYCIILLRGGGCSCSVAQSLFSNLRTTARQAPLSFTISWSLLRLFHRAGDAIQPSHPLSSPSPPVFNLSQHQGLFQWVGSWHQVSKYWSFSFSISPSSEYSGLIPFRVDWLDLLAVQWTLRGFPQHHNLKHQFFGAQPFIWFNSHMRTSLTEKPQLWLDRPLLPKWCLCF